MTAKRFSVVVIDDTPMMRAGLRAIINNDGYTVVGEASDGPTGLAQVAKLRPQLVTLDLTMPGMSGLEVLQQLKATYPDVFVVVVSSTDDQDVVKQAFDLGAIGYVIKPFNAERILKLFAQLEAIAAKRAKAGASPAQAASGARRRAVLIEPSEEQRSAIRGILGTIGHTLCAEVGTVEEGLSAIAREKPDYVLFNADLPPSEGINALRGVMAVIPGLPVIVLSKSADRAMVTEALGAGAKGFILLPLSSEKLTAAIRRLP